MKKSVFWLAGFTSLILSQSGFAQSHEAVHAVAWTPASLKQVLVEMPTPDIANGEKLHRSAVCMSCHGEKGIAETRNAPTLAGNNANYLYKTLLDYQQGLRNEGDGKADVMQSVAKALSKQEMADLAGYYAVQAVPKVTLIATDADTMHLIKKGDPQRLVTACAACHGLQGQGGMKHKAVPLLAGMEPSYFIRSMKSYREGTRQNDVHQGMAQFAKHLTDAEIANLAKYYQGDLPAK
jgi:cytochrome c553